MREARASCSMCSATAFWLSSSVACSPVLAASMLKSRRPFCGCGSWPLVRVSTEGRSKQFGPNSTRAGPEPHSKRSARDHRASPWTCRPLRAANRLQCRPLTVFRRRTACCEAPGTQPRARLVQKAGEFCTFSAGLRLPRTHACWAVGFAPDEHRVARRHMSTGITSCKTRKFQATVC